MSGLFSSMRLKILLVAATCVFFAYFLGAGEVGEDPLGGEKKEPPKKETASPPLPHGGEFIDPADAPGYKKPAEKKKADEKEEEKKDVEPPELDQKKVNAAIKKGAAFLVSKQRKDGSFDGTYARIYPMGYTALVTLTLLKCGVPARHPAIARAFQYLSELQNKKVYSVSLLLMALEAKYYNPKKLEKFAKKQEKKDMTTTAASKYGGFKPRISPADRRWAAVLAKWLISVQASTGAWSYAEPTTPRKKSRNDVPMPRTDNSNTQYAVLGLKAARRLGIVIPAEVFIKNLLFFIRMQVEGKEKIPAFTIPAAHLDSFEYKKNLDTTCWLDPDRDEYVARGWEYASRIMPSVTSRVRYCLGSMVTAGVSSVIICKSELIKYKKFNDKMRKKTNQTIEDGCAWLVKYYSVQGNPSSSPNWKPSPGAAHYYYYLYGLERACTLSGLMRLGNHDWYREGVVELLKLQRDDGTWMRSIAPRTPVELVQTCFALLFLKRATIGVIDSEIIYTGDGIIWKKDRKKAEQEKDKANKDE